MWPEGRGAAVFEPFTSSMNEYLSGVERHQLVVLQTPPEAIVFERMPYRLIDVASLRAEWTAAAKANGRPCAGSPTGRGSLSPIRTRPSHTR